ncbi:MULTISPECIES: hypothetical protein [Vibrio]|uniref:hypothetical protein n=1 Tax=Vibrio TaxID=662 RepID=UPI00097EB2AE|nr:hypothetical protein [Vibrio sp.]SJN19176.1 hypothetical protein FM109_02205 [Vibrio casei]
MDKWLKNDTPRNGNKKNKRDFDDYDGELVEKSKSKRKTHRERTHQRSEDFEDRLY